MRVTLTKDDLIAFEQDIADEFLAKKIRAPIHLSGGNEEELIQVFGQHVGPEDWICCTWRSHYHCLLKGVPPAKVKAAIMAGKSIAMCFPEYRVISSAIVGGMAPIAVGLAMGIVRRDAETLKKYPGINAPSVSGYGIALMPVPTRRVICFIGDMAFESGIVQECIKYSYNHCLPLLWVVEDNGLSTFTRTLDVWKGQSIPQQNVIRYFYTNKYPHCGVGKFVEF